MKILAIVADIDVNNLGGAEWHFVEVLKRLLPKIESATLVVGPKDNISRLFNDPKINVITIDYPHIPNLFGLVYIIYATIKVLKLNLKEYDLIWAKQEFPQGVVAGIFKNYTKTPIYLTSQSARLHIDELVVKGELFRRFSKLFQRFIGRFVAYAFRKADLVGAVSNYSISQAKFMGAKNVFLASNGVDFEKFKFIKNKKRGSKLKIVTTSSLINRNAVDVLIEACALLPAKIDWQLDIAGDGILLESLKKMTEELGVVRRVKFLGRVPNVKIPNLLIDSSVFVRVSRAEGFGSSFIEAMSCGTPVIATPVGGIVDFITKGLNGILVQVDDPKSLSLAIEKLWNDEKLYEKLRLNAKDTVDKKYNWDIIALTIWNEWNKLLNDDPSTHTLNQL